VWRDEDGSLLMDGMSGATEDVMAEAIERSCVVVVCVSRAYKESPNCRLEAKYAQQLYKKGKVRLAFVMMNEGAWCARPLRDSLSPNLTTSFSPSSTVSPTQTTRR